MALDGGESGKAYEMPTEGTHVGVCLWVIDLGTREKLKYQSKDEYDLIHSVALTWELDEVMEDGRPFTITHEFTLQKNGGGVLGDDKSRLRQAMEASYNKKWEAMDGDEKSLRNLIGTACQLSIIHKESKGKTYANVDKTMALPKGMPITPLQNEPMVFLIEQEEIPESLPKFIRTRILSAMERQKELPGVPDKDEESSGADPF